MKHHVRLKWRTDPELWDVLWKNITDKTVSLFSRSERILDVGCGDSSLFVCLEHFQERVIGIDINRERLRLSPYQVVLASAYNLPFRKGVFNGIHCRGIIHHLDMDSLFSELLYVAEDKSKILVLEPLAGVFNRLIRSFITTEIHESQERPLSARDVKNLSVFINVSERKYLFWELSYLLPFIVPLLPRFSKELANKIVSQLNLMEKNIPPIAYVCVVGVLHKGT